MMETKEMRLLRLKDKVVAELESIGLKPLGKIDYVVNTRAKRQLGVCKRRGMDCFMIEVSEIVFNAEDAYIKEIIMHEILHTFPKCLNHGPAWQAFAERVNRELGYNVTRLASRDEVFAAVGEAEYMRRFRYKATCQGCGKDIYRVNTSKFIQNPNAYHCRCGGKYIVVEL